ncbi:MAG: glycosyltransferase [bacterium]
MSAQTNPLRIAFVLDRDTDLSLLLPVADRVASQRAAAVVLAAVGWEARETLEAIGLEYAAPDDTDWFVRENDFDLIVIPLAPVERGGLARRIASEAAARGIPTLAMETDPGRPAFAPFGGAFAHLALAGAESYARAIDAGWPEERVAVTGSTLCAIESVAARTSEGDGVARVLVVSSRVAGSDEEIASLARALCAATAGITTAHIEIAEALGGSTMARGARSLASALSGAGVGASVCPRETWRDAIADARVVVTDDLSAALLAAACGIPVLALDTVAMPGAIDERTRPLRLCDEAGLAVCSATSDAQIERALRAILADAGCGAGIGAAAGTRTGVLAGAGSTSTPGAAQARARAKAFFAPGPPDAAARVLALAESLARARRTRVESALARVRAGNTRLAYGDAARAEEEFRAALAIDPTNSVALGNLGVVTAERGNDEEALALFAHVFELDPGDETARFTTARLLARRGDLFGAARHVEDALAHNPQSRGAHLLLGDIYLEAGLPEQAFGLYESANEIEALGAVHRLRREEAARLAGLDLDLVASAAAGASAPSAPTSRTDAREAAASSPPPPRLSIVVVAYNSAEDLPGCLESIARTTRVPHEVIVVDNASSDGTRALLRERRDVALVESDVNVGYSRAANLGIRRARGEAVVLLNPDTLATPGWDERMLAHVAPGVGAVGPLSNYVAGQQKFEMHVTLAGGQITIEELARVLAERNAGRTIETKLLIGFCLLITRAALDAVGAMDEDLFLGNDDLEYSLRLRRAGFRLVIATDAFVFHKGQRSFKTEPSEKTNRLVEESTNRLQEKLEDLYGAGNVPSPQELWGIGWFQPTRKRAASAGSRGTESTPPPKTSIVILTWNELEYTKKCVASIRKHTPEPHEIIFVDNGSTDGTPEWLATMPGAKVIANAKNLGFAAGANQGIRAATGERILLLNNDTLVTEGWLSTLGAHLDADASCGLVGPISNYVSGPQLDTTAKYDSEPAMAAHARRVRRKNAGRSDEVRRLVGFCLLARAEVFRSAGLFDEGYSIGNFEDDDFSLRAVLAGWRLRIARDAFIHHFGSRTFVGNKVDYRETLDRNKAYFLEKWRGVAAVEMPPAERAAPVEQAAAI